MEVRDLPGLRRARQIRVEPGDLFRAPRHVLERELGVQGDEMHRPVVETVVALGMIRVLGRGTIAGERKDVEIGHAVSVARTAVVIALHGKERTGREPSAINREEPILVASIRRIADAGRGAVGDVPRVQRDIERVGRHERCELVLRRRVRAAIAERNERDGAGAAGRGRAEASRLRREVDAGDERVVTNTSSPDSAL